MTYNRISNDLTSLSELRYTTLYDIDTMSVVFSNESKTFMNLKHIFDSTLSRHIQFLERSKSCFQPARLEYKIYHWMSHKSAEGQTSHCLGHVQSVDLCKA